MLVSVNRKVFLALQENPGIQKEYVVDCIPPELNERIDKVEEIATSIISIINNNEKIIKRNINQFIKAFLLKFSEN